MALAQDRTELSSEAAAYQRQLLGQPSSSSGDTEPHHASRVRSRSPRDESRQRQHAEARQAFEAEAEAEAAQTLLSEAHQTS